MTDDYSDIINLPHHVSSKHPRMSMLARAGQFAPFSALNGHNAAINETARLTDGMIEADASILDVLNRRMSYLLAHLSDRLQVRMTHFVPDGRKAGGRYVETSGIVKKLDDGHIVMTDGTRIPVSDIISLSGEGLE